MTDFEKSVFDAVKQIPYGRVTTYGAIAVKIGKPRGARAVGNALHKNPTPILVPCHRVVHANGKLTSAFVFGGINAQKQLLESEGVLVVNGEVDIKTYGWYFNR